MGINYNLYFFFISDWRLRPAIEYTQFCTSSLIEFDRLEFGNSPFNLSSFYDEEEGNYQCNVSSTHNASYTISQEFTPLLEEKVKLTSSNNVMRIFPTEKMSSKL